LAKEFLVNADTVAKSL